MLSPNVHFRATFYTISLGILLLFAVTALGGRVGMVSAGGGGDTKDPPPDLTETFDPPDFPTVDLVDKPDPDAVDGPTIDFPTVDPIDKPPEPPQGDPDWTISDSPQKTPDASATPEPPPFTFIVPPKPPTPSPGSTRTTLPPVDYVKPPRPDWPPPGTDLIWGPPPWHTPEPPPGGINKPPDKPQPDDPASHESDGAGKEMHVEDLAEPQPDPASQPTPVAALKQEAGASNGAENGMHVEDLTKPPLDDALREALALGDSWSGQAPIEPVPADFRGRLALEVRLSIRASATRMALAWQRHLEDFRLRHGLSLTPA